jgi:hypothetical protein
MARIVLLVPPPDAVKTNQLLRTVKHLESFFIGDLGIVVTDGGFENLEIGGFLAKIGSKSDLAAFLAEVPMTADQYAD